MSINTTHGSIADHISLWGNSASIALLDPGCIIFSVPDIPGIIGYRFEVSNIIVFGDPVCPPEDMPALTQAFHAAWEQKARNIIYVGASEEFTNWLLQGTCKAAINFGHEIVIDPTDDPRNNKGKKASLLRGKCNQAIRFGVSIYEYSGYDERLEQAIESIPKQWINTRQGPQIYSHTIHVFVNRACKRYFYAEQNGIIIGVLILTRLDAYKGWVLSFLMVPDAHESKGTSELLLVHTLAVLRAENATFFSIGTVPSACLNRIEGLGYCTTWFARNIYRCAKRIFNLGERQRYWKKFNPTTRSTYLVFHKPRIGIRGVLGIIRSFNASV